MAYSERAAAQRRCTSRRGDGLPCKGWAVWSDPARRYGAHGGRRRWHGRSGYTTVYPPCTCVAYTFPHRPGGGLCRWPDPPTWRNTTPAGTHSLGYIHRLQPRWG